MNEKTLQLAIDTGKLLLILSPVGLNNQPANRIVGELRSALDEAVYRVITGATIKSQFPGYKENVDYIEEVHVMLLGYMGRFHVDQLVGWTAHTPRTTISQCLKDREDLADLFGVRRLSAWAALRPGHTVSLPLHLRDTAMLDKTRGDLLRAFGSLIRNDSWVPTLIKLGVTPVRAIEFNAALCERHSSRQGMAEVPERKARLINEGPVAAKSKKSVSSKAAIVPQITPDDFVVYVALPADTVSRHPVVREMFNRLAAVTGTSAALSRLVTEAIEPKAMTSAFADAQALAQDKLLVFINGMQAIQAAVDKENSVKVANKKKKDEDAALIALKAMGPLLKVLQGNPALLAKALASASE